jgi:FkbH-like protein
MDNEALQGIELAMRRYKAQASLFEPRPSRVNLLGIDLPGQMHHAANVVNVWRNHGFESMQPLIAPYAAFRSWPLSFRLSAYDDSFSFNDIQAASVELLWMDASRLLSRIQFSEWLEWLKERLGALRKVSSAPVVLATWVKGESQRKALETVIALFPAVYFADLGKACVEADIPLLDHRTASLAGTSISNRAQVLLARELGCKWLAGACLPPVKALAVDLDNTLHSGVLGEEGYDNVRLTMGHANLQRYLKELQQRGVFLALVSRNEMADVKELFAERSDYPLRWEDFSAIEISWADKASAIKRIADKLRISTDSILFVDDNPGELAEVTQALPRLQTLYAHKDANHTRGAVENFPGLWRWKQEADDVKRIRDISASLERESLVAAYTDPADYFRSLHVHLTYYVNAHSQLGRLSDLCRKTNQFNLAIRRFSEAELFDRMRRPDTCVASVQLSDRLADSGIVAVIVAERIDKTLQVQELCISCRAMGRRLENDIIVQAIRRMPIWAGCEEVEFLVQVGERNQPARNWLNGLIEDSSMTVADGQSQSLNSDVLQTMLPSEGIFMSDGE